MFYKMSDKNFNKLQRIQNRAAARIVCGVGRRQQNARQLCHNLHWLPVYSRTDFKLATLSFKSHVMRQPDYLAVTLDRYEPSRSLDHRHNILFLYHFYRAMLCKRGLCCHAVSVRPSVRLSRSWITSKRINIFSKFFHYRVATPF